MYINEELYVWAQVLRKASVGEEHQHWCGLKLKRSHAVHHVPPCGFLHIISKEPIFRCPLQTCPQQQKKEHEIMEIRRDWRFRILGEKCPLSVRKK